MLGFETLLAASSRTNPLDTRLELQRDSTDGSANAMRLISSRGTTVGFLILCALLVAFIVYAAFWLGLTAFILAVVTIDSLVYFEVFQPRELGVKVLKTIFEYAVTRGLICRRFKKRRDP